jgi:acyl dehydratase
VSSRVSYEAVAVGTELPSASYPVSREDLVRYSHASGDDNGIHLSQARAQEVGLPDVIAHGMFTMASAARVLTDWLGDPAAVLEYGVRFIRPVVVPDVVGAVLEVGARVVELLEDRRVRVELTVSSAGLKVLGQARAVVQLR